jgi:hypothetical protein
MQGNQAMAVVGKGEAVGEKHNNQIEAMTAEIGDSGHYDGQWCLSFMAMGSDSGEARAR